MADGGLESIPVIATDLLGLKDFPLASPTLSGNDDRLGHTGSTHPSEAPAPPALFRRSLAEKGDEGEDRSDLHSPSPTQAIPSPRRCEPGHVQVRRILEFPGRGDDDQLELAALAPCGGRRIALWPISRRPPMPDDGAPLQALPPPVVLPPRVDEPRLPLQEVSLSRKVGEP
jgi:hypothetical protein